MTALPLTYAGLLYWDRTLALLTGDVRIPGVDLSYVTFDSPGDLFRRQAQHAEFPVSEMSMSTYLSLVADGDERFVGLPIFPSRNFRHGQVYVHASAGIDAPADLRGKRVGIYDYQMTAALWIRAFLQHDYGVGAEDVHWHYGGLLTPEWNSRKPIELPASIDLQRIPEQATLEGLLEAGELDALVTMQPPRAFTASGGTIRRLFEDFRSVEQEYYERTSIFPIMHLVVIRRDVYERNRWLAVSLLDAFNRARRLGLERLQAITGLAVGLPWLASELESTARTFGGDPFAHGVAANIAALEAMSRYGYEQHVTSREVDPQEMFAAETYVNPIDF